MCVDERWIAVATRGTVEVNEMSELVKVSVNERIAEVVLNRPKAYNAFNLEMVELLANRLIDLAAGLRQEKDAKASPVSGDSPKKKPQPMSALECRGGSRAAREKWGHDAFSRQPRSAPPCCSAQDQPREAPLQKKNRVPIFAPAPPLSKRYSALHRLATRSVFMIVSKQLYRSCS